MSVRRKAFHGIVHGVVQGVAFRYYTREKARSLDLTGFVRNLPDGTVGFIAASLTEPADQPIRSAVIATGGVLRSEPESGSDPVESLSAGDRKDVARQSVPLKPYGMPVFATASGSATSNTTAWVEAPKEMPFESPSLEILIGPTVQQSLLDIVLGPAPFCQVEANRIASGLETATSDLMASLALQKLLGASRDAGGPQAQALDEGLKQEHMGLDLVIEIVLDREIAKNRIMGRRLCANDNNHPNHIAFDAIKPVEKDGKLVCRVCGGDLSARADDQDEDAIDKRHNIYYDENTGTMAAVNFFKSIDGPKVISVDGSPSIQEVLDSIMKELD